MFAEEWPFSTPPRPGNAISLTSTATNAANPPIALPTLPDGSNAKYMLVSVSNGDIRFAFGDSTITIPDDAGTGNFLMIPVQAYMVFDTAGFTHVSMGTRSVIGTLSLMAITSPS